MTEGMSKNQMLIDAGPVGMAVYQKRTADKEGATELKLLQANPAFCDALGMKTLDTDVPFTTIIGVQGGKETDWHTLVTTMLMENPSQAVHFLVKNTGRWCRINMVLQHKDLLLVYLIDETENKQREEAVFQVHPDLMFVFDADGNYQEVYTLDNSRLLVPVHQLIGTNLMDTFPEEIARGSIDAFREAIKRNKLVKHQYTLNVTGKPEHFEARIVPLKNNQVLVVVRDVTEDVNIKRQLEFQAAILDQIEDHVTVSDTNGVIHYVNETQCCTFGISKEDFIGKTVDFFGVGDEDLEISRAELTGKSMKNGSWEGEIVNIDKEGNEMVLFCRDRMMRTDSDEKQYIITTLTNITHRKKAEEALVAEKEKAEAANSAKTRFLANMSHEIRTPMNGMMGFIQLLHMTKLDEEQQEYVQYIDSAARSLLHVISDVLDITKIESEIIQLDLSPFNIRELVTDAVGLYRGIAAGKSLSIMVHVDSRIPDYLTGDALKLKQVMTNLVSNAIKFTDQGVVEVEALFHRETEQQMWLQVNVKDEGIGIEETYYEHIFDPFVQVDMTISKRFGGTGLGLSIVKKLIELMGGSVTVSNGKAGGSVFQVLVPLGKVNP